MGDGVIDDVERVGSREVTRNLNDQRRRVDHSGLDNQDKNPSSAKAAIYARDHTKHVPVNGIKRPIVNPHLKRRGSPDPEGNKRGGCKVCRQRETEDETVPNCKCVNEGAVDGLSSSEVVGLTNASD